MSLKDILSNIDIEDFYVNYYQKKPLYIKKNHLSKIENYINKKEIYDYLSSNNIYYPSVRLIKNEIELEKNTYSKENFDGTIRLIDMDRLFGYFLNGATLTIQSFQRQSNRLQKLCLQIQDQINIRIGANIYISPKNSKGFGCHYDTHDVIIYQVDGKKKFSIYDCPRYLPTQYQYNNDAQMIKKEYQTIEPRLSIVLEAGDCLYLPRGYVHKAEALDVTSIHCTLGLFPLKWHDLFNQFNNIITEFEMFRETIPIVFNEKRNTDQLINTMKKIIIDALDDQRTEHLINELLDSQKQTRLQDNTNRMCDFEKLINLNLDTKLKFRDSIKYDVFEVDDSISLMFYSKTISFPSFMKKQIEYLTKHTSFIIKDLPENIDDESKLIFVKKLVEEGLLTFNDI